MSKEPAARRQDFRFLTQIQTRWSDNDMFGHINNVEYYRFFEMVVIEFLRGPCGINSMEAPFMTFAAESRCRFLRPLSWPKGVTGGLLIEHLGNSSVRYGITLFGEDHEEAAADGHWTHVFVDRDTQRPIPIPDPVRDIFRRYQP